MSDLRRANKGLSKPQNTCPPVGIASPRSNVQENRHPSQKYHYEVASLTAQQPTVAEQLPCAQAFHSINGRLHVLAQILFALIFRLRKA